MRFVLIDRLLSLEPGHRATARVMFPPTLEIFEDHYPNLPIVPGTLMTEAMGQTAGWLIASTLQFRRWPLLSMIDQAKFYRFVRPGEVVITDAVIHSSHPDDFEVHAEAHIDGKRVARARLLFHAEKRSHESPGDLAFDRWAHDTFVRLGGDAL